MLKILSFVISIGLFSQSLCAAAITAEPSQIESISEEAMIYGYPMIEAYKVIYDYAINKDSGQYKAPFNTIYNEDHVFTPKDTAVVTPNSDTPYSFVLMDLQAEPIVLCVPEVEEGRYYSLQLTSLYTFNFGYIGSRTTGNGPGCYAVVGPNWQGEMPPEIKKVFRAGTQFAIGIYRTQLFNPEDIANVKKIQQGYKVQTLSEFTKTTQPKPAPEILWLKIDKNLAEANPFLFLNFLLQFAPVVGGADVEKSLREKFATIGIDPKKEFSLDKYTQQQKEAMQLGIKKGMEKIRQQVETLGQNENNWRVATSGFGDRKDLNENWILRAAAAMAGIFGNDAAEAIYPMTRLDEDGQALDGSKANYTLTFNLDEIPPVNAFWSVTMYDGKSQLLIDNPINRYLINSAMLPNLKRNADGSITIYIQKDSPGQDKETNWLPAPNGPIYLVMRLYWPKEAALNGEWQPPAVKRAT